MPLGSDKFTYSKVDHSLVWNKLVLDLIFYIFKGGLSLGEEGFFVQPASYSHLLGHSKLNSCGWKLCQNQSIFSDLLVWGHKELGKMNGN